jgi:hypothetical protein
MDQKDFKDFREYTNTFIQRQPRYAVKQDRQGKLENQKEALIGQAHKSTS